MVNTQYPLPPQPLHIYDIKLLDNRYIIHQDQLFILNIHALPQNASYLLLIQQTADAKTL